MFSLYVRVYPEGTNDAHTKKTKRFSKVSKGWITSGDKVAAL